MLIARIPDGRRLRLRWEGPLGDWVASLIDADDRAIRGRWLLKVISDLLELPRGEKPNWVMEIVGDAMGRDTSAGRRYPCPCCDFLTLTEPPTGTFAICPVCRWEDDNVQFEDLDYEGGANKVSLREARESFHLYAVSDRRRQARVRDPLPEERP